jgi:hypothetical protein
MNEMFEPDRVKMILEQTLSSVLADMAFLDCQVPVNQVPGDRSGLTHCVAIDALKPGSFRIELRVSEAFRKKVIGMIVEPDAGPSTDMDSSEADFLLEILNVLAGNFLTAYFGQEFEPKLELPRYLFFSDPTDGKAVAETWMDAEGELIEITLRSIRYRY